MKIVPNGTIVGNSFQPKQPVARSPFPDADVTPVWLCCYGLLATGYGLPTASLRATPSL